MNDATRKESRRKRRIRGAAALLSICMIGSALSPAMAVCAGEAGETDEIHIGTVKELEELAENCSLDSWSKGKTVILDEDLDLKDSGFKGIPTFGGVFDGQGHEITGLSLTESGNIQGLFRYVQSGATVRNLTVKGTIAPSGRRSTLGGITGSNRGTLVNCSVSGSIEGKDSIRGIAGINEAEGQIINCRFSGSVSGEHYAGGIAGQNAGAVIRCINEGSINTEEVKVTEEAEDLNQEQINAAENVPVCTDIGGVAGISSGILQSCRNSGAVGYAHVGYNVGGIVGRQSGWLDGCANDGNVWGRKDVGGIVGQLEPEMYLQYGEDTLKDLVEELDVLQGLMGGLLDDTEGVSDSVSGSLKDTADDAENAREIAGNLADSASEWADENIGEIENLLSRISWVLDQVVPVGDDAGDIMELVGELPDLFSDVAEEIEKTSDLGEDVVKSMKEAVEDLQRAAESGEKSFAHLRSAMENLKAALGVSEDTAEALGDAVKALRELKADFTDISDSVSRIISVIRGEAGAFEETAEGAAFLEKLESFRKASEKISGVLNRMSEQLAAVSESGISAENLINLKEAAAELKDARQPSGSADSIQAAAEDIAALQGSVAGLLAEVETSLNGGNGDSTYALESVTGLREELDRLDSAMQRMQAEADRAETVLNRAETEGAGISPEDAEKIRAELDNIRSSIVSASAAVKTLGRSLEELLTYTGEPAKITEAAGDLKAAGDDLEDAMKSLTDASGHFLGLMDMTGDLISQTGEINDAAEKAGDAIDEILSRTSDVGEDLYDIISELAEKPAITIHPVSSEMREQGDELGAALSELLKGAENFGNTVSDASGTLIEDLRAINDQFGVIVDLLRGEMTKPEDTEERFEDISDLQSGERDGGTISGSENSGTVEGDINTAGIAGSMAVEYDFDPEDDLTEEGERSADFQWLTRAVISECVNNGEITGKKDYTGGITGRMDLGRISSGENYGAVTSADGNYVGGIAGSSRGSIRDSWAKCSLGGSDYVGGIAGFGSKIAGCHTFVDITEGEAYLGAIAGDAEEEGEIADNTFAAEGLAAIDSISYAGKAEPVSFDALCTTAGVPEKFARLELTFTADGKTVAVIPFQYGEGVESLPEIPAKKGYSASWPDLDYSCLTGNTTVEAVYTPYTSALSDGKELPQILADGSFSAEAKIEYSTEEVSWEDESGRQYAGTAYTADVDDPVLKEVTYTIHYRLPDSTRRYTLWIRDEEGWSRQEYETDGSYMLLPPQTGEVTFCVTDSGMRYLLIVLIVAAAAIAALTAVLFFFRKRRRSRS